MQFTLQCAPHSAAGPDHRTPTTNLTQNAEIAAPRHVASRQLTSRQVIAPRLPPVRRVNERQRSPHERHNCQNGVGMSHGTALTSEAGDSLPTRVTRSMMARCTSQPAQEMLHDSFEAIFCSKRMRLTARCTRVTDNG